MLLLVNKVNTNGSSKTCLCQETTCVEVMLNPKTDIIKMQIQSEELKWKTFV